MRPTDDLARQMNFDCTCRSLPVLTSAAWFLLATAVLLSPYPAAGGTEPARELRVCADPNNLPFSNERQEGFENKIAELIARDLGATVRYTWWAQRRGFIRNTLRARACDVVMGVPSNYDPVLTTTPYYRSTYVFLYAKDRGLAIRSLDDPLLRQLRVGVHVVGDDYANPPPAHALARRQIITNVVGYSIYGNYLEDNPPARIVDAVGSGEIDVAIIWGPFAGYFAKRQPVALEIRSVPPDPGLPLLPFVFDISLGVRKDDTALKQELEEVLQRRQVEIRSILEGYGIPLVQEAKAQDAFK
jgi:quinoprotein dehydrogenase-associated probable ABC transporter substrate-binding protein